MEYHWIVIVIYIIAQVTLSVHALMSRQGDPQNAMLWLLLVLLIPAVGIVLYLFFGFNRVRSKTTAISKSMEQHQREREDYFKDKHQDFSADLRKYIVNQELPDDYNPTLGRLLPESSLISGNRVELLCDGVNAYAQMMREINSATTSIHLQSFIIGNDETSRAMFDAIERRAEGGVEVKVIYDGFGSIKSYFGHFFHRYTHKSIANFQIRAFSPLNIFTPWRIQMRNHRKLMIVDGRIAFTGGINISDSNFGNILKRPKIRNMHDLHCRITGPVVSEFQMAFLRDWVFVVSKKLSEVIKREHFPTPQRTGLADVRVVSSGPGQNDLASMNVFFAAAATAQKTLWIMSPYFVPDQPFVKALTMAVARGVDVKIIVPKLNNHFFVDWAAQSLYRTFLSGGVKIYSRRGAFSHSKAMLVDGKWSFMGSSNCDVRSFRLNYELDFCAWYSSFIDELRVQFEEALEISDEISLESVMNKSFKRKFGENLCALLIPVL